LESENSNNNIPSSTIFCSNCGIQIPKETPYCIKCGVSTGKTFIYESPKTSGMAIASLICSVVGFFICFFVGQILGIIFGYQARKEIQESQGRLTGEGLATAGIIVGWIGIALDILIIAIWGLFGFGLYI